MPLKTQFSKNYILEVDIGRDGAFRIRIKGPIPGQWRTPDSFGLADAKHHAFLWATQHFRDYRIPEEHASVEHIKWESE